MMARVHCRGRRPTGHAAEWQPKPHARTTRRPRPHQMQVSTCDLDAFATPWSFFHRPDLTARHERIAVVESPCNNRPTLAQDGESSQTKPARECPARPPPRQWSAAFPVQPRDTTIIAPSPPCAAQRQSVLRVRDTRPTPSIVRAGSYSRPPTVAMSFENPESACRLASATTNPATRQKHWPQNMCFSIPRCAMILLPISSIEVWVVLSEGMFSLRKMRSAMTSSRLQRSSLAYELPGRRASRTCVRRIGSMVRPYRRL